MIPFANRTVTLYNRYLGEDEDGRTVITWHRHMLNRCFWDERVGQVMVGETLLKTYEIMCQIEARPSYRPYERWEDRDSTFTLSPNDVIVLGAVADEITEDMTINQLRDKYKRSGVMTVKTVQDNSRYVLPHFLARGS